MFYQQKNNFAVGHSQQSTFTTQSEEAPLGQCHRLKETGKPRRGGIIIENTLNNMDKARRGDYFAKKSLSQ